MLTIGETVERATAMFARQEALVCGADRFDYATFADRCKRLVGAAAGLGLQRGDRVAVLAANCHRFVECFTGLPSGGFVVVPLNYRLAPAELASILADSGAKLLITDRSPDAIPELVGQVEHLLAWPDAYEAALAAASPLPFAAAANANDVAALFYTGGTTGRPKGVMITHSNLVINSFHKTIGVGLRADDVFLAAPAMFHVAGISPLLSLFSLGARVVTYPMFDPAGCLDTLEREGCTMMFPVPTMLAALVTEQRGRPRRLDRLRLLGHAASPISTELLCQATATFPSVDLAEFYGATETTAIVTCLHDEQTMLEDARLRSCGQPVPGISIRIVGPDGTQRPTGEIGELHVRSGAVMVGYWNNPEATAAALTEDGWYRTGDLGYLDDGSYLYLVDRAKDMIVSGGENVYSIEVENALASHPAVIEATVFGIPHERWGEAVHAVVVTAAAPTDEAGLSAALIVHCRAMIAAYKAPKSISFQTDPLPKSGPGKVLKRTLRDPYWSEQTAAIS